MIAKIEVRKRLALYEKKLREERKEIERELEEMKSACTTSEMEAIWRQSKEYTRLNERWQTLHEVVMDIIDIRCEEMFNDYN